MGFGDWLKKAAGKVGRGFKKVGSAVVSGAKKVGDIGGKVVDVAKKIQPFVKDIPVVGRVVSAVADAGGIVDIAKKIGRGDIRGGLEEAAGMAADFVPGPAGAAIRRGKQIYEGGRGIGLF